MNQSQIVTPYMTLTLSDRQWDLDETRHYPCGEVLATSPITGFDTKYWVYLDIQDHETKRSHLVLKALIDQTIRDLLCYFWDLEVMPEGDQVEDYLDIINWHCLIKYKKLCPMVYKGHERSYSLPLAPGLWAVKVAKVKGEWQLVTFMDNTTRESTANFLKAHPWIQQAFEKQNVKGVLV